MSIQGDARGPLGIALRIDLKTLGSTFIPTPTGKFILRNVTVTNPSTTLAGSASTIGLYTGTGATGTTLVTPSVSTTLTSAAVFADKTIAAATAVITPAWNAAAGAYGVYAHVAVVDGGSPAATLDMYLFGDTLVP